MALLKTDTARWLLVFAWLAAGTHAVAQPVFSCTDGRISFFSEAPLEDIEGKSGSLNSVLNTATGEVVFIVPMRSFRFRKSLMKEHFNEKYVESAKYPRAVYRGKIRDTVDYAADGTYPVTATGTLDMHGVARTRTDGATLTVTDGVPTLEARFRVAVADHGIAIPKILTEKIADTVAVTFRATYVPYRQDQ